MKYLWLSLLSSLALADYRLNLTCEIEPLKGSEFAISFPNLPVLFEQRRITAIGLDLNFPLLSEPILETVHISYEWRAKQSLVTETASFELFPKESLKQRVNVPLMADWFGNREARLSWDPVPKITWNNIGGFSAKVPGWVVYLEASDPYHREPFETSLRCLAKERKKL